MVTATGPAPGSEMTTSAEPTEDRSTSGVLHVAAIFASHMVLQRNKPIAVFGALDADCAGLEVSAEIRDFDGSVIVQAHAYASKEIKNSFHRGASCCRHSRRWPLHVAHHRRQRFHRIL